MICSTYLCIPREQVMQRVLQAEEEEEEKFPRSSSFESNSFFLTLNGW
jgi:hypothetical protein